MNIQRDGTHYSITICHTQYVLYITHTVYSIISECRVTLESEKMENIYIKASRNSFIAVFQILPLYNNTIVVIVCI